MMPSRDRTYFVADVHLGLDLMDPADREARFVRFLKSMPAERTEALYMLGDIWDFWYEYRDVVPKGYVRVFSALLDLMDAGVKVYFFQGNHDIWCYRYFEELGMTVLRQPCLVTAGGKTFCLGHGDGLGPVSPGYRLMRRVFHNRLAQRLFSMLHPYIAFSIGKGWSRRSRLSDGTGYVFRGKDEPLYRFAEEYSSRHKVDYFVFGHYHCSVDLALPSGARLKVLKDWMEGDSYLYFSGIEGWGGSCQNIEK